MRKILWALKKAFFIIVFIFALLPICYLLDWCSSFMPWFPPFWEWLSGVSVMYSIKIFPRMVGGVLPAILHGYYAFNGFLWNKFKKTAFHFTLPKSLKKSSIRKEILFAQFLEMPMIISMDLQKVFSKHIMLHYVSFLMPKGKKAIGDVPFENIKSIYSLKTKKHFYHILFMFAKVKTKMLGADDSYIYFQQSLFYKKKIIAQSYSKFAYCTPAEEGLWKTLKRGYGKFPIISPQEYFDDIGYTDSIPQPSERIKALLG